MSLNRLLALLDSLSLNILSHSQESYLILPLSPPVVYTLADDLVHGIIKKMEIRWLDGCSSSSLLGWQSYSALAPVSHGSCSCGGTACFVNYYPCFLFCRGSAPIHTETRLCLWSGSEPSLPLRRFSVLWSYSASSRNLRSEMASLLLSVPCLCPVLPHYFVSISTTHSFFFFFLFWDKVSL